MILQYMAGNSYTWCYDLYRQPMDMVLQNPMLAMHHHNVHNWITARFLFYAQVSSLVLRFNSRLKTPLSGLLQAVQHGPHCIWRCDRLCTWRKRIHCIFAPDALAPFAIVRGAQTYHESLKDVCPQEDDLEHWSTRICTQSTYNDRLLHSDNHRLLQWSPTRVLRRVASYPWDSSQATHAQLTKHGIIRLFAHGILFTQRQEESRAFRGILSSPLV